jgi:hypothetical protein
VPDPADAKTYAQSRTSAKGLHWPTYETQIQTESGWQHWSSPGVVKSSPTGSMGLGQLNSRFYPREKWADPYVNLDTSIDIMAGYLLKFGTYRKALAAYNWGPANVAGYTDGAGRVHPAWDGTRAWVCPHVDVVPSCRTAQRDHYLDVILGPAWKEPNVGVPPPPSGIVYEDYRDPEPAGRFPAMPKGIILHGSRSGVAGNPKDAEYAATARYEVANPNGLGWHATIGEGKVAVHMTPQEWGWHALQASKVYIGIEFAQAVEGEPITDPQVAALADWIKTRVQPAWPTLPLHFPSHAEADREQGVSQGKTDAFKLGDPRMDELRARLMAQLGKVTIVPPPSTFAVGPGLLAAMQAHGDQPATDEIYVKSGGKDMYSEALGRSGARYVYLFATNATHRYDPAA